MDPHLSPEYILELRTRLKRKFPQLSDTDLNPKSGKENDMFRMIAYKLGKTKQELQVIIKNL